MKLTLRSTVSADLETVYQYFDADLFRYLLPPGAQRLHFGGSKTGDTVHLKLPLAGEWLSEITTTTKTHLHLSSTKMWFLTFVTSTMPMACTP